MRNGHVFVRFCQNCFATKDKHHAQQLRDGYLGGMRQDQQEKVKFHNFCGIFVTMIHLAKRTGPRGNLGILVGRWTGLDITNAKSTGVFLRMGPLGGQMLDPMRAADRDLVLAISAN